MPAEVGTLPSSTSRTLTDAIIAQGIANPLKAAAITFPGELLHQRHPSMPYRTWDMILDASPWGD